MSSFGVSRQRGISLISLMIGLLVSLLAVMGMMALYRTVMHTTSESAVYARLSGDRSAAILAAHSYLQEAGFALEEAAPGADVALCTADDPEAELRGAGCAPTGRGKLLLWRLDDGTLQCAGLHITDGGGLEYLQPQPCAGGLATVSWPLAQRRVLFAPGPTAAGFVALQLLDEPCQALGVAGAGALRVRLEAEHPVAADPSTVNETVPIYSSTCLVNIRRGLAHE